MCVFAIFLTYGRHTQAPGGMIKLVSQILGGLLGLGFETPGSKLCRFRLRLCATELTQKFKKSQYLTQPSWLAEGGKGKGARAAGSYRGSGGGTRQLGQTPALATGYGVAG